jgi:Fur family ferric uptake transcriptional regulator
MALEPLPKNQGESLEIMEPLCAVFRRKLKSEGLKYTPERAQILDAVIRQEGLFEAEKVQGDLKRAGFRVSKATVYRTIRLLQDSGIIQRVLINPEQSHFQVVYGHTPSDLIIRVDGGAPIAIDAPELVMLRERLCREHRLVAVGHRLHVFARGR